jgi:hypothetical protein
MDANFVSMLIGSVSILCWIIFMCKPIIKRFTTGKTITEFSDSIFVPLLWLFADSMNLVGIFMVDRYLFQKIGSIAFVCFDLILLSIRKDFQKGSLKILRILKIFFSVKLFSMITMAEAYTPDPSEKINNKINDIFIIGIILGTFSNILYITSRFIIISKFKTKKLEPMLDHYSDLSSDSTSDSTSDPDQDPEPNVHKNFIYAIMGNFTSLISIFIKISDINDVILNGPWIIGPSITLILDIFIFFTGS